MGTTDGARQPTISREATVEELDMGGKVDPAAEYTADGSRHAIPCVMAAPVICFGGSEAKEFRVLDRSL